MNKSACLVLLTCLLAVGCEREDKRAAEASAAAPAADGFATAQDSERTWVGLLPCSDCQGIDTRLVLRVAAGGRREYLLTETYLGGRGKNTFERKGRWSETSQAVAGESLTLYVLDPGQAGQRFALQPDGALEVLDGDGQRPAQGLAYRLQRL